MEIVDEEIHDLLQPTGAYGHHTLNVVTNEWEGPMIKGVNWVPMTNQHQLADYFVSGTRNRTTRSNEFGKLADSSVLILDRGYSNYGDAWFRRDDSAGVSHAHHRHAWL